jgi:hypothetical protein
MKMLRSKKFQASVWSLCALCVLSVPFVIASCGGGGSIAPITMVKAGDGKVSFEGTVQPILVDHCKRCHDQDKKKGSLYLMTYEGLMQGGDLGKVVQPGDPDASLIVGAVEKKKWPNMPPKVFPALTPDRLQALRQWIAEGAVDN